MRPLIELKNWFKTIFSVDNKQQSIIIFKKLVI